MQNYSDLVKSLELALKATKPYMEAVSALERSPLFSSTLLETTNRLGIMSSALDRGIFSKNLESEVSGMLRPYNQLTGVESAVKALGSSFDALIKPSFYEGLQSKLASSIPALSASSPAYDAITTALSASVPADVATSLAAKTAAHTIDTSWLQQESSWLVERTILSNIDTSALEGIAGQFANLCQLEKQTSLLPGIPEAFTSAASQIASITSAYKPDILGKDLIASSSLLSDYCALATKQHKLIQKAGDQSEIDWRLGVIDAASKYVDRQTAFTLGLAADLQDEISEEERTPEIDKSPVLLIPTYIGYTRRENVQKTPSEGLAESALVSINEKGKRIAKYVTTIDRIQRDNGSERIFTLSEALADALVNISTVVCTNFDELGTVIDGLYFIFYENLEHIKTLAGGGDNKKGDQIIRDEDIYQIIFNIKTIRSDLRHDLDHGAETNRHKKFLEIGDCYRKYCGGRPLKAKDFRKLQEGLYDELQMLIERIIAMQTGE